MKLDHYPLNRLQREIALIVGQHLDLYLYRLFFFGSRVNGQADDSSDVDVGIDGPERVPRSIMGSIREGIEELPTLYSIDVVDFKSVSPEFRAVALQQVQPIQIVTQ